MRAVAAGISRLAPAVIASIVLAFILGIAIIRSALVQVYGGQGAAAPVFVRNSVEARGLAAMQAGLDARDADAGRQALGQAREVLADDPLSSRAFVAAAFALEAMRQGDAALDAMEVALKRDPRNSYARNWMIDRSLRAGRYAVALEHLDAAMRQQPDLRLKLTQAMVPMLAANGMVEAFATRLAQEPVWGESFLDQARREPALQPRLTALMLELARSAPNSVSSEMIGAVSSSVISQGNPRDARRIYSAFFPQARDSARGVFNGGLNNVNAPAPFNWTLSSDGTATATFVRDGSMEGIEVRALGGAERRVADQFLTLPAGRYVLASDVARASLTGDAVASWRVTCPRDGRILTDLPLPSDGLEGERTFVMFSVPPECGAQRLMLMLRQQRTSGGAILVDSVELERTGAFVEAQP